MQCHTDEPPVSARVALPGDVGGRPRFDLALLAQGCQSPPSKWVKSPAAIPSAGALSGSLGICLLPQVGLALESLASEPDNGG